jgi:hypothetical protein
MTADKYIDCPIELTIALELLEVLNEYTYAV